MHCLLHALLRQLRRGYSGFAFQAVAGDFTIAVFVQSLEAELRWLKSYPRGDMASLILGCGSRFLANYKPAKALAHSRAEQNRPENYAEFLAFRLFVHNNVYDS